MMIIRTVKTKLKKKTEQRNWRKAVDENCSHNNKFIRKDIGDQYLTWHEEAEKHGGDVSVKVRINRC